MMRYIMNYLLKYKLLLFFCVLIVCIQAYTGLKIPTYIADMVNTGIQNGGVKMEMPERLSKELFAASKKIEPIIDKYYYESSTDYILTNNNHDFDNLGRVSDTIIKNLEKIISINDISEIKNLSKDELTNSLNRIDYESYSYSYNDSNFIKFCLINKIMLGESIYNSQLLYIKNIGILMGITTLFFAMSAIIVNYIAAYIASNVAKTLRGNLFNKILSLSPSDLKDLSTSSLINRCTNNVDTIKNTLMALIRRCIYSFIVSIWAIIITIKKSGSFSLLLIAIITIITILFYAINKVILKVLDKFIKNLDKFNLLVRENINGLLLIRSFNNQNREIDKFKIINKDQKEQDRKLYIYFGISDYTIDFLLNICIVLVIIIGAASIEKANFYVGDLLAFIEYVSIVIYSILGILYTFFDIPRIKLALNRIVEILELKSRISEKDGAVERVKDGKIELKNVSFSYDSKVILNDITFKIEKGEFVAIVGTTGSGKSTLAKLLLRQYDVNTGNIFVDNLDIRDYKIKAIKDMISYAPQKSILLNGSVKDNILFGKSNATDEEIIEVLKITDSYKFIFEKAGLDTDISQEAKNLSGGQKQRLSMARAIIKDAPIYLFDDCFSALDLKTDEIVRKAVLKKLEGKTVIIVAQRISTILNADKIIVLDEGKIIDIGNHAELANRCTLYKEILESQRGIYEE